MSKMSLVLSWSYCCDLGLGNTGQRFWSRPSFVDAGQVESTLCFLSLPEAQREQSVVHPKEVALMPSGKEPSIHSRLFVFLDKLLAYSRVGASGDTNPSLQLGPWVWGRCAPLEFCSLLRGSSSLLGSCPRSCRPDPDLVGDSLVFSCLCCSLGRNLILIAFLFCLSPPCSWEH